MKTFEALNKELKNGRKGAYAPYYYRYLGYKKDLNAKPDELRSNGVYALFTESLAVVLKNEWIAGNHFSLFVEKDESELDEAMTIVNKFGERHFGTNKDHYAPNYRHILSAGIPGIINEIDASLLKHADDQKKVDTLLSMKKAANGFLKMIELYIEEAKSCKGKDGYDDEKLDFIIANLDALTKGAPSSFPQALQLVWLCHNAFVMESRGAMALGRLDQYLYPFYKADIESGAINDDRVIELFENVFIKLQNDIINICIGGQNKYGECEVNPLSLCILKAVRNCNVPGPNLSLRYTLNTPDEFLDECLKVIGTGLGYPALMNDDVNLAALRKYGYEDDDLYDYCMVGCIENLMSGKQPPWSDGRFDAPRFFDYVFNRGISEFNGSSGIDTGDVENITSMEEFMKIYEKQLALGVKQYCDSFNNMNSIKQEDFPDPFLSLFCDDCIGRGLDINNGGSKYPSVHGAALMGIGTVSDSLAAIEKVVFVDKEATLAELRDAMNSNFEGYEELHNKLLSAPKYGNNDDFVDKYAVWYLDFLGGEFDKFRTRDGGWFYIAAAANTNNIGAGSIINATPDGRKRGEPLSDAASPTYGRDQRGVTAVVNSLTKPDYTKVACGSVVNQKFSPSVFDDDRRAKLLALIKTYFKKGGQEIQINSTSRETLIDAMEHPENYQSLVVRVSGFSARYVTLQKEVQLDILNRTQHE